MKESQSISRRDFLKIAGLGLGTLAFSDLKLQDAEVNPGYFDVLDANTQTVLAAKAKTLISLTPDAAIKTADFLRNSTQSSADNICGPLAMAQLIHSVNGGVLPVDYWLAPIPGTDEGLFDIAFPQAKFEKFEVKTPLGDYNFNSMENVGIQPGDFLFMVGKNKGFSHMMTISRRGRGGTLYALTNYPGQDKKYIIREVPFWKPNDPEGSWVKELANGENSTHFSTGEGGFYLWRLKAHEQSYYDNLEAGAAQDILRQKVDDLARVSAGDWHVLITNIATGRIVAESGSRKEHETASVIKVPLAMAVMTELEREATGENDLKVQLGTGEFKGQTFNDLLKKMLIDSDENATAILRDWLASKKVGMIDMLASWGAEKTKIASHVRISSASDMQKFFTEIYKSDVFEYSFSGAYLMDIMKQRQADKSARLGTLSQDFGLRATVYNKIGSLAEKNGSTIVADSGIIEIKNKGSVTVPYFVSLTGQPRDDKKAGYSKLEDEMKIFVKTFADFCGNI